MSQAQAPTTTAAPAGLLELEPEALPTPDGRPYRRRQLAEWIYLHGARSFEAMTNLPRPWREALGRTHRLDPFDSVQRYPSRDGSVRYLLTLPDGRRTEAVYMPYEDRKTVCVSSMVGCPAGCAFCATGALGFGRNLTRGEIVGQILAVAWHEGFSPREIRNVVLMGMGEALLNYREAVAAVRRMVDPEALAMSPRRITVSTVGLPKGIERLAGEGLPLTLALSLHAPDDETRRRIIPTAHAHDVASILASLRTWQERVGRRITVEYTLLSGVNDADAQADALAERLRDLRVHVNLIPFNAWDGSGFRESSRERTERFRDRLERTGTPVSVRFSRGRDTGGACGQLSLREGAAAAPSGRHERPAEGRAATPGRA